MDSYEFCPYASVTSWNPLLPGGGEAFQCLWHGIWVFKFQSRNLDDLEIISFSKGTGSISFIFDGYDICHNSEEVLEKREYNKDSDIEYTSNSIFCSKGQAYVVKGNEVKEHMHCIDN